MRVGLLGDVRTDGVVPDLVVRSWRRSISSRADGANPAQRFAEIDTDSILCRAADPVLDRWQSHLTDTGTTLFLSDRAGAIVARRASDSSARRRLDNVHAAEGFDYSEDAIGTNGLGTSMVEKRALLISGSQHYNDALATLACRFGDRIHLARRSDRICEPAHAFAHPGDRPADRGAAAQLRTSARPWHWPCCSPGTRTLSGPPS